MASDRHLTWKTSFLLYLLLRWPKGLVSCTAFPSGYVIHVDGSPVPSLSFLTSWLRPRTPQFLTLVSRNFRCRPLRISSEMTWTNCCSVPSGPFGNTCPGWISTVQILRACLFALNIRRRGCPVAPFPSFLRCVISLAHASTLEEDCRSLRVRAHEVRKVVTCLLFKRNCAVHQVLKAGT